jgi:PAS domain S-box-containing protein
LALVDALPANVALLDGNGQIVGVNDSWRRFGRENGLSDQQSCVGANYLEVCRVVAGADAALAHSVAQGIQAILDGRQSRFQAEYPCHSPEEERWFQVMAAPIPLDHTLGAVVMHIDISQRVRAEGRAQDEEARQRQIIESLPQLVWACQPDGACDYLSPQWLAYTGSTAADQLGWGWLLHVHPDDQHGLLAAWYHAVKSETALDLEIRIRRFDGTYRWFKTRAVGLRNHHGKLERWFGTHTDVNDMKQLELAVRRSSSDLEQQVRNRTAQLEAANQELESFSYTVSHDLRAPLRHIEGFASLLGSRAERFDPECHLLIERIRTAAQHMAQMIDSLLQLSRVGRSVLRHETVDLAAEARALLFDFRATEPQRQVEFIVPEHLEVFGDADLLRIVLQNLLGNAWKYTSRRAVARIELGVVANDGNPVYFVRDDGAGFDATAAQKLFSPFQRFHPASEFPGTGIGLATVQRIIHRHGGRVGACSEAGCGATFLFTLGIRV